MIYCDVQGVGHSYQGVGYLVSMEQGYILSYTILENLGLNCIDCVGDTFVASGIYLRYVKECLKIG